MKNIFTAILLLSSSIVASAGNPPKAVQKAFKEKFGNATAVKWIKENATEWEAEFLLNSVKISANFSNDGTWVETETTVAITELPLPVVAAIKKQYPIWTIVGAAKIEVSGKVLRYEADIKAGKKKKEVFYTGDGTLIK